jgi:hypothetical protein
MVYLSIRYNSYCSPGILVGILRICQNYSDYAFVVWKLLGKLPSKQQNHNQNKFFSWWLDIPNGAGPPHYREFTITLRHTTIDRTPLDEWSNIRRDLYLTTHNNNKRQTLMPPAGFEPAFPINERPQSHALDRAAAEIGLYLLATVNNRKNKCPFLIWISCCTSRFEKLTMQGLLPPSSQFN